MASLKSRRRSIFAGKRGGKRKGSMYLETERFNNHIRNVLLPKAKASAADAILTIALELDRHILVAWPVDTGRSRAAWSILLVRHGGDLSMFNRAGSGTSEADRHKGHNEGLRLGEAKEKLKGSNPTVELINGVDYSPWLEAGASQQAPQGVLRQAMQTIRKTTVAKEFKKEFVDVR